MKREDSEMTIPHLFRCPISLDLFKDPVTLCTGQTYDRSSIEQWLASGNLTCPVTMQQLHDRTIVPNHTLRDLINRWLQNRPTDPQRYSEITSFESLEALKQCLATQATEFEIKLQALQTIRVLSEGESPFLIARLGFLPLLLKLVLDQEREDTMLAEQATSCIVNLLSFSEPEYLNIILNEDPELESFSSLFKRGNVATKTNLCQIISFSSSSLKTKQLCSTLGQNSTLLNEIAILIHHNSSEASNAGIKALWAVSSVARNLECLVKEGIIDGVISYISSPRERGLLMVPLAMRLVERLLGLKSGKEALLRNPSGVSSVVKRVFEVSSDHGGSESAVGSLAAVCGCSLKAREEAIEAGVLTQLLLLLQSQVSVRTKTKATMLLKLLRS